MRLVHAPLAVRRAASALLAAAVALSIGCRTTPPPAEPGEPAPTLRLDDRVVPASYDLRLALDPAQPTFDGEAAIEIDVRRPARTLWLNARGLDVTAARIGSGLRKNAATVVPGGEEFVGFVFAEEVPAGRTTLHVSWRGTFAETATDGAFRQKDGDRWYVFTQFESIYARRAFPSFDEPQFKTPWKVTIDVPPGNVAYANMPVERQAASSREGWTRYEFARSLPLPTYLVAFAVGPFEEVPAGTVGNTPLRILTLAGKASQAAYAARVTAPILQWQETYTGIPYPYGKLDSISIPQTVGFGAMENVGLITYVEPLIIAPPAEETVGFRRSYSRVAAHEIGHQWFGDLVTMKWWDDIWLNESFATWFGGKTIGAIEPSWTPELDLVERRSSAMGADSLDTARRIRQPIATEDDIENAFDAISYSKGGTLLSHFERWLGEEEFRRGIQAYLREYAHANANASDFLRSLEGATRPGVAAAFSTFLDQSGVPLVSVRLDCSAGATPRLARGQTRYIPAGSHGET
ncbi:MAG TPA: M1 family metallopeptidase, partial [Thermoanaerobaculia bacterium]